MTDLAEMMTVDDEERGFEDVCQREPDLPLESSVSAPLAPDGRCVSSIKVGQNQYWCATGAEGHAGLCRDSDPWGGHVEWRFWVER
jgi:hypothetical protein